VLNSLKRAPSGSNADSYPGQVAMSANGPSVWTGRALQAENDDLEKVGLALLYPAY